MRLVTLLFLALPAHATVVLDDAIQEQLSTANLEAEIQVERLESVGDAQYGAKSTATARVLKILKIQDDGGWFPGEGDTFEIETLGGEVGETGVIYSGYPRPYVDRRYRATLGRSHDHVFKVRGFGSGLVDLNPSRGYSRNRTDGSNGNGSGPYLYWDRTFLPIPYYISLPTFVDAQNIVDGIDAAFKTWRDPGDVFLEFIPMGCTSTVQNRNDGINAIIYIPIAWAFDKDAIAITRNFYVSGTGARAGMILDTDILLNGRDHSFTTTAEGGKHDVRNILTHEVGHFIGMGHETDPKDTDSTMFENAQLNGETKKRDLSTNDFEGLRAGYSGVGQKFFSFPTTASCSIETNRLSCLSTHGGRKSPSVWLVILGTIGAILSCGRALFWRRRQRET